MSATKNFQAWLIRARKKAVMSYAALARESELSTATIHGLEHSDTSPTLDTVEKLCKALGVSVEASLRVRASKPPIDPHTASKPCSDSSEAVP